MKAVIVLLVLGILLVGCAQQSATAPSPNASNQTAAKKTIHIEGFAFNPPDLAINKGDTVVWINNDGTPHLVKFADFQSEALGTGDSYEHTFSAAGEYAYVCGIHPSMKGKVTVK